MFYRQKIGGGDGQATTHEIRYIANGKLHQSLTF